MPDDLNSLKKRIKELEAKVPFADVKAAAKAQAKAVTGEFQKALAKLSTDPNYRAKAIQDPTMVSSDFKLTVSELHSLRSVAIMSGVNVKMVEKVRVNEMLGYYKGNLKSIDIDISCCCCCCCGETAVKIA